MAVETVNWRRRHFPFNAEQTVNILGEIGPLVSMFLVNGIYGIAVGTWALIGTRFCRSWLACGCSAAPRSCRSSPARLASRSAP